MSQDYVNGTDQEEIRTGKIFLFTHCVLVISKMSIVDFISVGLALRILERFKGVRCVQSPHKLLALWFTS